MAIYYHNANSTKYAQGENRPLSGPLDNTKATGLDFSFDEIVDWLNSPNDFLLDQQNLSVGAPFVENVSPNQLEEASCSAMDSSHRNNIDPVTNFGDENEHSISDSGSLYSPNDEEGLASFQTNKLHSHEGKKTQSTNASINVSKPSGIVNVCHVESSSPKTKKYFCIYCHKRVTKISRHLKNVHKEEDEVKKFLNLPKGTAERKRIILLLRSAGSFIYNTNSSFNKGNLQVSRRPQMPKNRTAYDYIICPHSKESYSKISLRRHVKKCLDTESKEKNSITVMGRRIRADIHPVACNVLRDQIYPYLK